MKVISFNANGIRAAVSKGFDTWLQQQQADFVCIQETKAHRYQLESHDCYFPAGYYCHYVDAQKKGYSGVALYAKVPPLQIIDKVHYAPCDDEGRYVQFDYPNLSVISLYLPSGTSGDLRQSVKFNFLDWFATHLLTLRQMNKPLIICGDFNIAHHPIDLKNWRANQTHSGFLPEERVWLDTLFGTMGFVDAFRVINQEKDQYTWWSHRGRAWEKNVGWRIDYQVITPQLQDKVAAVTIEKNYRFSDHAPLIIDYHGVDHA